MLCAVLSLLLVLTVVAQEKKISKKDVPATVIAAFEKAYPKATVKGCAMEVENGTTYYEIESIDGKTKRDLLYLPDGTVAEIEQGVAVADLPAAVRAAINKEYPKGKIEKAEKTTKGSAVTYEMKIVSGKSRVEFVVDPAGKIVKKEK